MSYSTESLVSPRHLDELKAAVECKFTKPFNDDPTKTYKYSVPIGYEREIITTPDGKIIINNFDHDISQKDVDYLIGQLSNNPDTVIKRFQQVVTDKHLDEENAKRVATINRLLESDLVHFD